MRPRIVPCLAVLALSATVCAAPSAVPERVTLRKIRFEHRFADGHVHVNLKYPQVTGLRDAALQARINHTIQSAYPPGEGFEGWLTPEPRKPKSEPRKPKPEPRKPKPEPRSLEPELEEPGVVEELECDYEVGLNRSRTLSIHFWGCDDFQKNGLDIAPHPNCQDAAVTLDTRTGRPFKLRDLFGGSRWRDRLDRIIVRYTAAAGEPKGGLKDEELLHFVRNHDYWYYLTPHTLEVYDIYPAHIARALRASIPYNALKPIVNLKGPLPRLVHGSR